MICSKCGLETFDNSVHCINCGINIEEYKISKERKKKEEKFDLNPHIGKAFITLLVLPNPISLVALICSIKVYLALMSKDLDKACKFSLLSNKLSNIVIVIIAAVIAFFVITAILALAGVIDLDKL